MRRWYHSNVEMLSWRSRFNRRLIRFLKNHSGKVVVPAKEPFDPERLQKAETALRQMPVESPGAQAYLEKHIPRLARTLALVPPPDQTGRVLELGCYMQITPLLQRICGYREVRGAYYGCAGGKADSKTIHFPDGDFTCEVDLFDVERDPFPYPDGHFDLVI